MACLIDKGSIFDCSVVREPGIKARAILINKEDYDAATIVRDGTTNAITSIALATGKQGYEFTFPKSNSLEPSVAFRGVDAGADGFDHSAVLRLFDVSQVSRESIGKTRFARQVLIFARNDQYFEILGEGIGLVMSDYQYLPGDAGNGGTIQVTLNTPDYEPPEVAEGSEIWDTDAATTLSMINTLIVPAV